MSLPITSNKGRALQIVESWNPGLENMEKMENTKQMSENTIYDSKHFREAFIYVLAEFIC